MDLNTIFIQSKVIVWKKTKKKTNLIISVEIPKKYLRFSVESGNKQKDKQIKKSNII